MRFFGGVFFFFFYISLISFKANHYCAHKKDTQYNLMDEYVNVWNGGKSRNIKSREERTKYIYMGIYGNVTTVLWLGKKNVIPENKGRVYGEGPLAEDSRDGHTP